jgi:hypothetical protein
MKRFCSFLEVLDIFGQPIKLTYKNRTKYKTPCGAVSTIFMIIVCLGWGLRLFDKYRSNEILQLTTEYRLADES